MEIFKPKAPAEDPNVKAARDAEQQRAEADRDRATMDQLGAETTRRRGLFGIRSLLGPLGGTGRSWLGSG